MWSVCLCHSKEIIKKRLQKKEKNYFEPLDIVYEPVIDDSLIKCFFTDSLHLAYRTYVDKKTIDDTGFIIAQPDCYYCDNYFACSKSEFLKHVK